MKNGCAYKYIGLEIYYWTGNFWTKDQNLAKIMSFQEYKQTFSRIQRVFIKFEQFVIIR